MKFLGVKVGHADIDAVACPAPAGQITFNLGLQLTSVVPAGVGGATISLTGKDKDGEELTCLNIDAKIKGSDLPVEAADTCSLYEISDGTCGQSDLDCAYTKYAKAAEKGLQDGTCADQGYTHQTGTQTKTDPIIGDIVITTYDQGSLEAADTCSLYEISDGTCGQSDLDCAYTKYAKAAEKGLQDGTCADQGYTHQTGTQTKTYPIIGDIVITTYDQGSLEAADTCSLYEISDGTCGQSDLDCAYTKYAKAAEKGLQDGTCADQGYTHQTGTQTKTYPIIGDIVITTYDQASVSV
jgi:phage-related protein